MENSEFEKWFECQFGKCPCEWPIDRLYSDVIYLEELAREKRILLDRTELWETKYTAARYAWNKIMKEVK